MKFLTMAEILRPCVKQNWAIGAYDTCNLEITQAIVEACRADQSPAIIMIYPHQTPLDEWPTLIKIIESEVARTEIPAALVLDHAKTLSEIEYALKLGFSGVMIDASNERLDTNIDLTRQAVKLAHSMGVSVEAELGHVGTGDELISADQQQASLTRVEEAERFVDETGVDALAISIGTLHGLYRGKPKLDFERIIKLRAACDIPLVLHGGSDTPDPDLRRAIELGIDKINIWTDVRIPFLKSLKQALDGPLEKLEVHQAFKTARISAMEVIQKKNFLLGATGKSSLYA